MSNIIQFPLPDKLRCYECQDLFITDETICCQEEILVTDENGDKTLGYANGDLRTRCVDCYSDYEIEVQDEFRDNMS